jgi:hypothetical protein
MNSSSSVDSPAAENRPKRPKKKYVPAVTPRLRIALLIVFGLFALLAANSVYMSGVTIMQELDPIRQYQDYFYILMLLMHLLLGFLLIVPFIIFATFHLLATRKRKNRTAVRMGYLLLSICIALLVSGILLTRIGNIELKHATTRMIVYFVHVITPLAAIWMYWLHRLAGPPIKWRVGLTYAAVVAVVVGGLFLIKLQDPRDWSTAGAPESEEYFAPSLVRTNDGDFIGAQVLMNDEYCMKCHEDIYNDAQHSAHRFSSFNNPWYLTSVMEFRETALKRDGSIKASRWCAGCHDPVPFFAGKFDDPNFDFKNDPTASASITCTICHSISNINSNIGNADYTIEEPIHYPFAYSDNAVLQWVNNQLVKAKPAFHKQMMLKEFHKTAEFCSACHKVNLPREVTHYKDWLRGQNHYDLYLLSGVSGHGLRSFYYPPVAQVNCNECHMPRVASNDFGARPNPKSGELSVHNHQFPSANTAIGWYKQNKEINDAHREFLNGVMRLDIFGVKLGNTIDAELVAPLRPNVPQLKPGNDYLLETVIRTMKMGHLFSQGTVDSNEIWMDVKVIENAKYDEKGNLISGQVIGRSGGLNELKAVDPWSHFVNVFMLDRNGNRIDRRNANDIFVPLYNHQIPPGAGQVVHYTMQVPEQVSGPITVEAKLQYRKFDQRYTNIVAQFHKDQQMEFPGLDQWKEGEFPNPLPITTLATDRITFAVEGIAEEPAQQESKIEPWQRWNDYGIGLLTEGATGDMKGELLQAEAAFKQVEALGKFHGPLNLARVYDSASMLNDAAEALQRADTYRDEPDYPAWTAAWLNGEINLQQGYLEEAVENFSAALNYRTEKSLERKFDFTKDYTVQNRLGTALFELAKTARTDARLEERIELLERAATAFHDALKVDSENVDAHYALTLIYSQLAEAIVRKSELQTTAETKDSSNLEQKYRDLVEVHSALHLKYKPDENARAVAIRKAREQYPWADKAAEALVLYSLNRDGAYELKSTAEAAAQQANETSPVTSTQAIESKQEAKNE